MLLSRENLTKHVASKDAGRGHLQSLCITKDGVVSSDGKRLLVTPLPAVQTEAFPPVDGFDATVTLRDNETLLLPAEDAKRIAAQVDARPARSSSSRPRRRSTAPPVPAAIAQPIAVDVEGARKNGHIPIATRNGNTQTLSRVAKTDGQYPDYSKVLPNPARALLSIGFNADYLAELAKLVTSSKAKCVKLTFFGRDAEDAASNPARLSGVNDEGREVWGILMPMRL